MGVYKAAEAYGEIFTDPPKSAADFISSGLFAAAAAKGSPGGGAPGGGGGGGARGGGGGGSRGGGLASSSASGALVPQGAQGPTVHVTINGMMTDDVARLTQHISSAVSSGLATLTSTTSLAAPVPRS